jgi:hypothetical protein
MEVGSSTIGLIDAVTDSRFLITAPAVQIL